ncbi:MAG: tRNA (adenosine(37)-N6)-threonylcarbamoyltransferase complex ATPase subunit type 1 TsaE [bacterium]|nr:tRNA (adenosine(37)-N6)-threonylcarbamoyltransferase complex ATPase subunit type 1 TsaE [bacterium]
MANTTTRVTHAPEETQALGRELAGRLRPGDCVGLIGSLGSGKTCLVQGICAGLGVSGAVTSPTFILIHEYTGVGKEEAPLPVYHFDLYRLGDPDELYALGCDDYFYGEGICLIEWADRAGDLLPEGTILIQLEDVGITSRSFTITGGR